MKLSISQSALLLAAVSLMAGPALASWSPRGILQRLSPFHGRPKADQVVEGRAQHDAKRKSTSPMERLMRRVQGGKKDKPAEEQAGALAGLPYARKERKWAEEPSFPPDASEILVVDSSEADKTSADSSGPAESPDTSLNESMGDVDEVEEESESAPYLRALSQTEEALQRIEATTAQVEAHWNAHFQASSAKAFGEHLRAFEAAVEAVKDAVIDGWRALEAAGKAWDESGAAWSAEHGARMDELHKGLRAAEAEARAVMDTDVTSLDCYRLAFLRQDEHLIDDLDALVGQFGLEADPALAAYQRFYGALAAVNEATEAVAPGLAEMPRLFKRVVKYSELPEFFGQRDTLQKAWAQMQAQLQEAEKAVQAYGETIASLEFGPKDADIAQHWQEQYQADVSGFAALVQSLDEELLSLYREYVAPSHEELMVRAIDQAAQGKPATPKGSAAEEALVRAEGLSVALRVDAKLPRELWARLQAETDEGLFETQLEALVGERHWINAKLDILRGRVKKVKAVTDEDKARLQSLREAITAIERGLPPALDSRALAQTAFIKAHPDGRDAMLAKLKGFERDYIADEADCGDGDDADPIHEIYEQLSAHYVALRKGELLQMQGRLLEKAYENVVQMAPGSVKAFLMARKAFDHYWRPHANAHQALQADFSALREAIKHVDPARQLYWKPIVQNADALLQPEAFAALFATAKKCTLPALIGHFKDVLIPGRHAFLGRFRETQQRVDSAEAALAEVKARRQALLSTAKDTEVLEAAMAFAEAGNRFFDLLDSAFESLHGIGESDAPDSDSASASLDSSSTVDNFSEAEETDALTDSTLDEEDGIDEVVFSLDKEAMRMLEERLLALEDAVEDGCIVTEQQLAAIPGVQGNGRLLGTVRSILEIASKD